MFSVWLQQSRPQKLLAALFVFTLLLTLGCIFICASPLLIRILVSLNIALAVAWIGLWFHLWPLFLRLSFVAFVIMPIWIHPHTEQTGYLFYWGVIIVGFGLFFRLVSDERLLHQKHIRTLRILLQQNLNQTVDYSKEAILIVNHKGRIIEASPKAVEFLASSHFSLSGMPIDNVIKDYPSNQEAATGEFVLKLKQGEERFIQYVKHPLLDHDVPSGTLLVLCDVTAEKKQFESYLQAAKFSVIAQVAGGLAHELRNPLTTIKGFIQLAGSEQWPERLRPYYQLVLDEIETTDTLLTQFLLLTNPSAPQLKPVNVEELVHSAAQILNPTCLMQEVSLVLNLPSKSPAVMGDVKQLTQTILSIIQNAIESSQPGQCIMIRLTVDTDKIKLAVEDSGSGISEDMLKKVFDPFFTTRKGKTGLGLTIAQQIVLAHHGELTLSRPPSGQGTLVILTLPIIKTLTEKQTA